MVLLLLSISCSKDIKEKSVISETELSKQVLEAYKEGLKYLNEGDVLFAAKKFNEVEILYPLSVWAPKSSLMAAYAYYSQDYYGDAIAELERLKKVYPRYKYMDYVHYLLAISHYEQIVDEKKDLQSLVKAKQNFNYLINEFPNSEYALDATFKIDLINDILAAKQMYLGRYYIDRKKWIAAINRFRTVVDEFETTEYTEEALLRLVEVHYKIELKNEAKKYANILGYNYQSSEWYKQTYSLFNVDYNKDIEGTIDKNKNKNKNKIKNFMKSLFD